MFSVDANTGELLSLAQFTFHLSKNVLHSKREHFQSLKLKLLKAKPYTYKRWTYTLLRHFNRIYSTYFGICMS